MAEPSRSRLDKHLDEGLKHAEGAELRVRRALAELRGNGTELDLAIADLENAASAAKLAAGHLYEARSIIAKPARQAKGARQ